MSVLASSAVDGRGRTHWRDLPTEVRLRAPSGRDELALDASDGNAALGLLGRLARDRDGRPLDLSTLTLSQIDRLLARLYRSLYGDRAECRVSCPSCGQGYEFVLDLAAIIAEQDAQRPPLADQDGAWTLDDGRRLRAPRMVDLVATDGPQALLERLVLSGDPGVDPAATAAFLERVAPVLTLDLAANCPDCGRADSVRFDLARYLVQRLAAERPFLLRETHLIASRYGWSHAEIIDLGRDDRRAHAGMIEAERSIATRRRPA